MKSQSFSDYYTDILLCIIGLPMAVVTLYGCIVLWQSTLDIKQVSIPGICNIKNITSSTYCEKALLFWQEEIPSECIGIKFSPVAIYSCNNGFDEDIGKSDD